MISKFKSYSNINQILKQDNFLRSKNICCCNKYKMFYSTINEAIAKDNKLNNSFTTFKNIQDINNLLNDLEKVSKENSEYNINNINRNLNNNSNIHFSNKKQIIENLKLISKIISKNKQIFNKINIKALNNSKESYIQDFDIKLLIKYIHNTYNLLNNIDIFDNSLYNELIKHNNSLLCNFLFVVYYNKEFLQIHNYNLLDRYLDYDEQLIVKDSYINLSTDYLTNFVSNFFNKSYKCFNISLNIKRNYQFDILTYINRRLIKKINSYLLKLFTLQNDKTLDNTKEIEIIEKFILDLSIYVKDMYLILMKSKKSLYTDKSYEFNKNLLYSDINIYNILNSEIIVTDIINIISNNKLAYDLSNIFTSITYYNKNIINYLLKIKLIDITVKEYMSYFYYTNQYYQYNKINDIAKNTKESRRSNLKNLDEYYNANISFIVDKSIQNILINILLHLSKEEAIIFYTKFSYLLLDLEFNNSYNDKYKHTKFKVNLLSFMEYNNDIIVDNSVMELLYKSFNKNIPLCSTIYDFNFNDFNKLYIYLNSAYNFYKEFFSNCKTSSENKKKKIYNSISNISKNIYNYDKPVLIHNILSIKYYRYFMSAIYFNEFFINNCDISYFKVEIENIKSIINTEESSKAYKSYLQKINSIQIIINNYLNKADSLMFCKSKFNSLFLMIILNSNILNLHIDLFNADLTCLNLYDLINNSYLNTKNLNITKNLYKTTNYLYDTNNTNLHLNALSFLKSIYNKSYYNNLLEDAGLTTLLVKPFHPLLFYFYLPSINYIFNNFYTYYSCYNNVIYANNNIITPFNFVSLSHELLKILLDKDYADKELNNLSLYNDNFTICKFNSFEKKKLYNILMSNKHKIIYDLLLFNIRYLDDITDIFEYINNNYLKNEVYNNYNNIDKANDLKDSDKILDTLYISNIFKELIKTLNSKLKYFHIYEHEVYASFIKDNIPISKIPKNLNNFISLIIKKTFESIINYLSLINSTVDSISLLKIKNVTLNQIELLFIGLKYYFNLKDTIKDSSDFEDINNDILGIITYVGEVFLSYNSEYNNEFIQNELFNKEILLDNINNLSNNKCILSSKRRLDLIENILLSLSYIKILDKRNSEQYNNNIYNDFIYKLINSLIFNSSVLENYVLNDKNSIDLKTNVMNNLLHILDYIYIDTNTFTQYFLVYNETNSNAKHNIIASNTNNYIKSIEKILNFFCKLLINNKKNTKDGKNSVKISLYSINEFIKKHNIKQNLITNMLLNIYHIIKFLSNKTKLNYSIDLINSIIDYFEYEAIDIKLISGYKLIKLNDEKLINKNTLQQFLPNILTINIKQELNASNDINDEQQEFSSEGILISSLISFENLHIFILKIIDKLSIILKEEKNLFNKDLKTKNNMQYTNKNNQLLQFDFNKKSVFDYDKDINLFSLSLLVYKLRSVITNKTLIDFLGLFKTKLVENYNPYFIRLIKHRFSDTEILELYNNNLNLFFNLCINWPLFVKSDQLLDKLLSCPVNKYLQFNYFKVINMFSYNKIKNGKVISFIISNLNKITNTYHKKNIYIDLIYNIFEVNYKLSKDEYSTLLNFYSSTKLEINQYINMYLYILSMSNNENNLKNNNFYLLDNLKSFQFGRNDICNTLALGIISDINDNDFDIKTKEIYYNLVKEVVDEINDVSYNKYEIRDNNSISNINNINYKNYNYLSKLDNKNNSVTIPYFSSIFSENKYFSKTAITKNDISNNTKLVLKSNNSSISNFDISRISDSSFNDNSNNNSLKQSTKYNYSDNETIETNKNYNSNENNEILESQDIMYKGYNEANLEKSEDDLFLINTSSKPSDEYKTITDNNNSNQNDLNENNEDIDIESQNILENQTSYNQLDDYRQGIEEEFIKFYNLKSNSYSDNKQSVLLEENKTVLKEWLITKCYQFSKISEILDRKINSILGNIYNLNMSNDKYNKLFFILSFKAQEYNLVYDIRVKDNISGLIQDAVVTNETSGESVCVLFIPEKNTIIDNEYYSILKEEFNEIEKEKLNNAEKNTSFKEFLSNKEIDRKYKYPDGTYKVLCTMLTKISKVNLVIIYEDEVSGLSDKKIKEFIFKSLIKDSYNGNSLKKPKVIENSIYDKICNDLKNLDKF